MFVIDIWYVMIVIAFVLFLALLSDYRAKSFQKELDAVKEVEKQQRAKLHEMAVNGQEMIFNHAVVIELLGEIYNKDAIDRKFIIKKREMEESGFNIQDYLNGLKEEESKTIDKYNE